MMNSVNLWQLIHSTIQHHADSVAVSAVDKNLSYKELGHAVDAYRRYLVAEGVQTGDRVGILLPRTSELVVAVLGVLSMGACYVPLSDRHPVARNQMILNDSQCRFLISQEHFTDVIRLSPQLTQAMDSALTYPMPSVLSDEVAYIIHTSGSTGKPKGVMISHANALSMIQWAMSQYDKSQLQYTLASTSISFDLSIFELFVPLAVGGCVVLVDNALDLIDNPPKNPLTLINTVPSAARALLAHAVIPDSVTVINLAGEALEQNLVDALYDATHVQQVYNLYGPSETTTYSTSYLAKAMVNRTMVPIGKPIEGTEIYLLDRHLQPVPPLAKGELYIAGQGVSLGYCQQADETAARYIQLRLREKTIRVYRTGDLARLNHAGEYEYLGRIDQQVKIHGFRIELDEIVKTIQSHPDVKQAVVTTVASDGGESELVGHIVLNELSELSEPSLRAYLSQWLPDYMLPQYVFFLDVMPLNANGKIDRVALSVPKLSKKLALTEDYQSDLEHEIAEIWTQLLAHSAFNRAANFFYVGGHSLLAARLLAKLKSRYDISCQLVELFQNPTIEMQALMIAKQLDNTKAKATYLVTKRLDPIPLSYGQERLWYLHHAQKNKPISNIPIVIKIKGLFDVLAFEASVTKIIQRHEILRTVYEAVNQQITQRIINSFSFHVLVKHIVDENSLAEELMIEANKPFDLTHDLMIRAALFTDCDDKHTLMITQHHIASDAWSLNIFMRELSLLYQAYHQQPTNPILPFLKVPMQYADYSGWQRLDESGASFEADLAYWRKKLDNLPEPIRLPTDRKRGELQTYSGAFYTWELETQVLKQIKSVANQHESTLFMVLLAAFSALLTRYSEQNDVCIGILSANRPIDELSDSLGFFVNSLVMRHQIDETTTLESLLQQVRQNVLEGLEHQQLPFDKLVEALRPQRQLNRHPLFDVLFSLQNALDTDLTLDGLSLEVSEFDRHIAKFDLTLSLVERLDKLVCIFEYNTDLFDKETIERMTAHYIQILIQVTKGLTCRVKALDLVSLNERRFLLEALNAQQSLPLEEGTIAIQFERMVDSYCDRPAIISSGYSMTYGELNQRATILAKTLSEFGVGSGMPVGILLARNPDAIISMLAVLKVGAYYVPMDVTWPVERLDFIIKDASISLVLTHHASASNLPSSPMLFAFYLDALEWSSQVQYDSHQGLLDDACYVMYTSGSTGLPKGVLAKHEGVIRLVNNTDYVTLNSEKRLLQVSPLAFDGSTFDIWGSLLNGAALVLMPEGIPELGTLAQYLADYQITTLFITTQLFNSLVEHKLESLQSVTELFFGGEVASIDHVLRFKQRYPDAALNNIYGPTECTTFALNYLIPEAFDKDTPLPLGRPIANTCAIILSPEQHICPINVAGEIYLGGPGLAKGYLNQPQMTADKFIENPFSELKTQRLYRTGDLGMYRVDGVISFLGRLDHQIKLRGYRIELSEIEQCLREISDILDAVVVLQAPESILVAYVIGRKNHSHTIKSVRQALSCRLPHYMLPDALEWMESYPLTNNGKIDKSKLPRWELAKHLDPVEEEHSVIQEGIQTVLYQIWVDILGCSRIRSKDNFFEMGGNSLKIILVLDRLQMHYKNDATILDKLDIVSLFQYPTLHDLANYLSDNAEKTMEPVAERKRVNLRDRRKQALENTTELEA